MKYQYNAHVVKVYDGDTVTVDVDLGFKIKHRVILRLYGIDTPEIRGEERPEGLVSRDYVADKILNKDIIIETFKKAGDKYGRWLATIYVDGVNLNQELVEQGLAEKYIV